jgi:RimJ/RimL family protein N-acetyltransferase
MFPLAAEGLVLRPSDEAAAARLVALLREPEIVGSYSLAVRGEAPDRRAQADWTQRPRDWATHRRLVLAAHEAEGDGVVGMVRLDRTSLSYFVDPARWGRGYAGAMVAVACGPVAVSLGLARVEAEVLRDNHRSRRVLERAGFRFAGLAQRLWAGLPASVAVLQFERAIEGAPDLPVRMTVEGA